MAQQAAELVEHRSHAFAPSEQPTPSTATPMTMLDRALAMNVSPEVLGKMMEMSERWEKNQARKAFDEAMAAARAEIKPIAKNREVDFTSQKGRTHYRYEDLGEIARSVDPILSKHGLSYRFRTTSPPNEPVTVTCIVSHRMGHAEENTLSAGRDESGNKNSIQAIGSTITFLQRYTLKAALGLAASNDDDGRETGAADPITEDQAAELRELAESVGADLPKFLAYMKVKTLAELPANQFKRATDALNAKRKPS